MSQPRRLRVMAELGSSGIFAADSVDGLSRVMITHDQLALSPELRARFDRWLAVIWDMANSPTSFDLTRTNEIGRLVAKALKDFLGPEGYVEYQPVSISGARGKIEVVT